MAKSVILATIPGMRKSVRRHGRGRHMRRFVDCSWCVGSVNGGQCYVLRMKVRCTRRLKTQMSSTWSVHAQCFFLGETRDNALLTSVVSVCFHL
jgi:hypothetical protein